MKIALVSEHASPLASLGGVDAGGQNVYVAELARALGARGHRVTVYTRRDARELPERVAMARGVDVVHVDAGPPEVIPKDALLPYMGTFGEVLAQRFCEDAPDVVHSHFWMSGLASRIAVRRHGMPWVHTYHALGAEKRRMQGADDSSPDARVAHEIEILREAAAIVATSSAEVFEHRRTGGGRDLKLIPCGVSLEQFDAAGTPWTEPREQRYRIVTLSRLVPRKGVDVVIRALARVPETELIVAGGGLGVDSSADPDELRLRSLAIACGVADRVRFTGPVERARIGGLLRSADVAVCMPVYEPFGLVPLEAMACGRPVVVSRVGGLIDTVVDGVTGYHVTPSDAGELAEVLTNLLADATLRGYFGAAGRRRVESRYAWGAIAERVEGLYLGLAASREVLRETTA